MNTSIETPAPQTHERRHPESRRWVAPVLLLVLVGALSALWIAGVLPRRANMQKLEKASAASAKTYAVAVASPGVSEAELVLPSSVEALQETPLYSRVNGYVRRIAADIGAQVNAGDVLAEIETPELDQQVAQARATLDQAKANLHLAQVSYGRWQEMQKSRIVAPQEVDERKGTLDARKADLAAAEASLQRLEKMQSYQKITAPFAGTVTKRFVEIGQLVTGDLNDATRMLFQLQHTASLRSFVHVPQSAFRSVSTGQEVTLTFRELPGRTFPGKVVRTAGALDGTTRTLRTEIHVSNESQELLPGLYAEVKFALQREKPPISIPARALILQAAGPQIATVDANNRVALNSVSIARDLGKTVELATGIEPGTRFIINPTDTLREGMTVNVEAVEPLKVALK
ncbi:efflux RND transporter periplasmic adaptor subunit [Verrucomicrobiota bacterium sgz303538]